ncbi:MAG: AMP-binding protein [Deltaproteobacteria bacterium]|nr:AMP-binding protein [Deltaproteobacteria bacterium]
MNVGTLIDRNVKELPRHTHLTIGEMSWSNNELLALAGALATELDRARVVPGDRVVTVLPVSEWAVVANAAIQRLGAVAVPLDPFLAKPEIDAIVAECAPKVVLTPDKLPGENFTWLPGPAPREVDENAPALIAYTSGTTGRPKGIVLSHRNLLSQVPEALRAQPLAMFAALSGGGGASLIPVPLTHMYGITLVNLGWFAPLELVVQPRFDVHAALAAVEKHKVRYFNGVPTIYARILREAGIEKQYDLSSVWVWLSGTAPLPRAIADEWTVRFGAHIQEGYGLSEAAAGVAAQFPGMAHKVGSIGVPIPGVEVRVIDDKGRELPRGEVGELVVRGPTVMKGYYGEDKLTAETIRDGWLYTGDLVTQDDEGYLFVVGRKKDLIIRGGLNVYPTEVESCLLTHAAVMDAAVVGVDDADLGERVKAFVVLRDGATATGDELRAHCAEKIAKYKVPEAWAFLGELPRNAVGKVLKRELKLWTK